MTDKKQKRSVSKGTCNFCGQIIAKSGIVRHLQSCKARQAANAAAPSGETKPAKVIHISVEGTYANMYWMHLEVDSTTKLDDLDLFLRHIWLECCDHLSQYKIENVNYSIDQLYGQSIDFGFDPDNAVAKPAPEWEFMQPLPLVKRMSKFTIGDVVKPGLKFTYSYDFGSTTNLTLKTIGEREANIKSDEIKILVRNLQPEIMCEVCGKNLAAYYCDRCSYKDEGILCLSCAKKHPEQHYEMFLPIVNSPRGGVCGYMGDAPDDWSFWH